MCWGKWLHCRAQSRGKEAQSSPVCHWSDGEGATARSSSWLPDLCLLFWNTDHLKVSIQCVHYVLQDGTSYSQNTASHLVLQWLRGYSNIIPDWYLLDDALCNNLWIVIYGPTFLTPPSWQDTIHVSVCDQQHKFSPVIPREKPQLGLLSFYKTDNISKPDILQLGDSWEKGKNRLSLAGS